MRIPFNGNYPITQYFGQNPAAYAQFGLKGHNGTDYGLPSGTSIVAAQAGFMTVLSDPGGFGVYCVVDGGGYRTLYAHLTRATTSGNVKEGQEIAKSGNTGNSTGPHLHFGVRPAQYNASNGYNGYIDPQTVLKGDSNVSVADIGIARILAFAIGGRNGYEGRSNALSGSDDAELKANHVGVETNKLIWTWYQSAEGMNYRDKTLFREHQPSQIRTDEICVRLAYNLGLNRDCTAQDIVERVGKQNVERLMRDILASDERKKLIAGLGGAQFEEVGPLYRKKP